jgi:hypothetical protein
MKMFSTPFQLMVTFVLILPLAKYRAFADLGVRASSWIGRSPNG